MMNILKSCTCCCFLWQCEDIPVVKGAYQWPLSEIYDRLVELLLVWWQTMICADSLFHGISSASLAGNLPYFLFDHFVHWKVPQLVTYFRMAYLMPGQYKCWWIIASVLSINVWRRYTWYQCNTQLWSIDWIKTLALHVIILRFF